MHNLRCWKFFIFLLENMSEVLRKAGWPVLNRVDSYALNSPDSPGAAPLLQEQRKSVSHHSTSYLQNMSYSSLVFEPRSFWHLTGRWNIPMMQPVSYEESWWWYCLGWCQLGWSAWASRWKVFLHFLQHPSWCMFIVVIKATSFCYSCKHSSLHLNFETTKLDNQMQDVWCNISL